MSAQPNPHILRYFPGAPQTAGCGLAHPYGALSGSTDLLAADRTGVPVNASNVGIQTLIEISS